MTSTAVDAEAPPRDADARPSPDPWRRVAAACAGPVLIVAGVSFALRGFAFQPLLTNDHPDLLSFWLPRFGFLGDAIASGHLPLWNPHEMVGYRFAADPQSGVLYVPAMTLFSVLSPAAALRGLIVLNPLIAGLGLFAFLRIERLSRLAATAGGLALAMAMAASEASISLPFAGFLAWTTLVLIGASGYRQAPRWSRRLLWLTLSAFAWTQVANAHMSHGLAMCSLLVAAYLLAYAVADVRAGTTAGWTAAGRMGLFLLALPLAGLAVLIPRLAFIGASSLHLGYDALEEPLRRAANVPERPIVTNGVWTAWPLAFGMAPGAYLGTVTLLAIPLAMRARRWRPLVWGIGGAFALTWLLMLNAVVAAGWFRASMERVPFGDVYLHNPGRLRYLALIALPVLGAVGLQGLRDEPIPARRATWWLGGGVVVLLLVPLAFGAKPARLILPAVALGLAVPALHGFATRRRRWATAGVIVAILGAELLASAVTSSLYRGGTVFTGLEAGDHPNLVLQPLRYPDLSEADYVRPTALVAMLRAQPDRYLTWAPPAAFFEKGYLFAQRPQDWPALAMERGTLFGIDDTLGYNPVQLIRYWTYIRATNALEVFYNASVIARPSLEDVRLMGIRYLIVPQGFAGRTLPGRVVARADDYELLEVYGWEPRVSVVADWTVAEEPADALRAVLAPGFDPGQRAVLEADPGIEPSPGVVPSTGAYREVTPEDVRIRVRATAPSIVVVRTAYDPGWTATVDGRPAPVIATDHLVQGIPVPSGSHEVRLTYRDHDLERGLRAAAVVWLLLAAAIVATAWAERRRVGEPAGPTRTTP
jgi:Bacterial membrane protein YfhO